MSQEAPAISNMINQIFFFVHAKILKIMRVNAKIRCNLNALTHSS